MSAIRRSALSVFVVVLLVVGAGAATASPATAPVQNNPGVIPNKGPMYADLSTAWWQWAYSFPAPQIPFLNTGGAVDISAHQSGKVWFLAGANYGLTEARTGTVPSGTFLFFPMVNAINDYPCPPEFNFEPPPGESLEHFLQRTGNEMIDYYVPYPSDTLFAEIDGEELQNLVAYRATSAMFQFTGDPAVTSFLDACVTGTSQPGVAVGYWLLLPPLSAGVHALRFGDTGVGQNISYVLNVQPGR